MAVFAVSSQAIGIYLALVNPGYSSGGSGLDQPPSREPPSVSSLAAWRSSCSQRSIVASDGRPVPAAVSILGDALVALGLFVDWLVLRENTYGAANIRVEAGQQVISSGPYAGCVTRCTAAR